MARTRVVPRAPEEPPSPGVAVRTALWVDVSLWDFFHKEWRRIEREWRGGLRVRDVELVLAQGTYTKLVSPGMLEAVASGVAAARAELRATIKKMAKDFPGPYLVPV